MEADSTTSDIVTTENNNFSLEDPQLQFPFNVAPKDLKFYLDNIYSNGKGRESYLVDWMQRFGLLRKAMVCPCCPPQQHMVSKRARVVDRVQWNCENCGCKASVRYQSIFNKLPCSLWQALQLMLAWCEDADSLVTSEHFGIKRHVVETMFERMSTYANHEATRSRLGGENIVVVSEMYPDCVSSRSPDTTTQKHTHSILMLADTKHVPTRYRFHVLQNSIEYNQNKPRAEAEKLLCQEVSSALQSMSDPQSLVLRGQHVPGTFGTSLLSVTQRANNNMEHFLCESMWRQAVTLCLASRELCSSTRPEYSYLCQLRVQQYLNVSLLRIQHSDGFYKWILTTIANRNEYYTY